MEEHYPLTKNLMVMVLSDVKTDKDGEVRASEYPANCQAKCNTFEK